VSAGDHPLFRTDDEVSDSTYEVSHVYDPLSGGGYALSTGEDKMPVGDYALPAEDYALCGH